MRAVGGRIVNVSTGGAIYGETDLIPTPETVEPLPEAPYGQSKFCAERYLRPVHAALRDAAARCGSATSTARARTRSARRGSSRSSAAAWSAASARSSTATAARRATTSSSPTWSAR